MNKNSRNILLAGISTLSLSMASASLAYAADPPPEPATTEVETVIVTGTRTTGMKPSTAPRRSRWSIPRR
jgi:iron complex outermembrane receptor protein